MDQLISASLSYTHCRYEVGMLKVPHADDVNYPARGYKVEKHHPEGENVRLTFHTINKRKLQWMNEW